jgi:hypothetical protein
MRSMARLELDQIDCPLVSAFLDELCAEAEYSRNPGLGYTVDDLLSAVLQCHAPHLTKAHFPMPGSPLTTSMGKLNDVLHSLALEIATNRGVQVGQFDSKCFLVFLKAAYPRVKAGGIPLRRKAARRQRKF